MDRNKMIHDLQQTVNNTCNKDAKFWYNKALKEAFRRNPNMEYIGMCTAKGIVKQNDIAGWN